MNLTLALDDEVVARARKIAREQGKSLNALVRDWLLDLVGEGSGADAAAELRELYTTRPGRSGGRRIRRDEAYEDRLR